MSSTSLISFSQLTSTGPCGASSPKNEPENGCIVNNSAADCQVLLKFGTMAHYGPLD